MSRRAELSPPLQIGALRIAAIFVSETGAGACLGRLSGFGRKHPEIVLLRDGDRLWAIGKDGDDLTLEAVGAQYPLLLAQFRSEAADIGI